MKKHFFIIIPLLLLISSQISGSSKQSNTDPDQERIEQILNANESDFRTAVINILKKSNTTNPEQFLGEIKIIESSHSENDPSSNKAGFSNIGTEYNGYSGWDVAAGGVFTVFIGLVLISMVVVVFNLLLKEKPTPVPTEAKLSTVKKDDDQIGSENRTLVPEVHITAIAVAVELYYRLYIDRSNSGITFSNNDSSQWRVGTKFGVRKTQRK